MGGRNVYQPHMALSTQPDPGGGPGLCQHARHTGVGLLYTGWNFAETQGQGGHWRFSQLPSVLVIN